MASTAFFSALERNIKLFMPADKAGRIPVEQARSWIEAKARDGKLFKRAEVEWSGILDWLTLQDGRVAVAEVAAFVGRNGVQVADVLKTVDDPFLSAVEQSACPDHVRYPGHRLPGKVPYREMLLVLKQAAGNPSYSSPHWKESGVLAHIRFTEREAPTGSRVMFVEEMQSDWSAQGRKKGFVGPDTTVDGKTASQWQSEVEKLFGGWDKPEMSDPVYAAWRQAVGTASALRDKYRAMGYSDAVEIPMAPFVTDTGSWVRLCIKRAMCYAAEQGFDQVAIINGSQAASIFTTDSKVKGVEYRCELGASRGTLSLFTDGGTRKIDISYGDIPKYIGMAAAERLLASPVEGIPGLYSVTGDLEIKNDGMRAFYDQIVPLAASHVLAKLGCGRAGFVDVAIGDEVIQQVGFTVTEVMRETVRQGVPLFSRMNDDQDDDAGSEDAPGMN